MPPLGPRKPTRKVRRAKRGPIGPPAPKSAGPAGSVGKKRLKRVSVVGPPAPKRSGPPAPKLAGPAGNIGKQETNPVLIRRKAQRQARAVQLSNVHLKPARGKDKTLLHVGPFKLKTGRLQPASHDKSGGVVNRRLGSIGDVLAAPTVAVAKDYIDINANAIPSLYHLGKTTVTKGPGAGAKLVIQPYKDLAKDPVGSFKEHPLGTALLLSGPKSLAGRGAGRTLRLAPKGSALQRAGSVSRTAKSIEGTTLRQERSYSPDVITKAGQVAVERTKARRVRRLEDKAAMARRRGKEDRADELSTQAKAADPSRMDVKAVQKRVDARVDANEIVRRQNRAKVTRQVDEVLPKKGKEAVPLVAQAITKPDRADLAAYRSEIKENAPTRPGRARQNKELRKQIKRAEDAPDMGAVAKAATEYRGIVRPLQDKLVDSGLLGKQQAEMAPLIPYATRHMGAKFVKEHYRQGGKKLSKTQVRELRQTHSPDEFSALVEKVPGRLRAGGKELSADAVRAHMKANGFEEPAYVTQAPGTRGARNYYVAQHEAPSVSTRQRTGEATRKGTFDAHPDVLREGAARMQGLVDAHEGYSKFVGEFANRGADKQVRTFRSHSDAADHAADLAETTGVQWRPVKLKPFAGRKEQLESLIDHTHPDNQAAIPELSKALEDAVESTDGPGPWALVPKVAADRMSQHVRVQGAGGGGKAFQAFTGAFRKAVLATSFKWLFGNVAEAGLRSAVSRSGPRSYVTGKAILKRLQDADPVAAQELQARALGGGHYAMADRMPARKAEQFKDTRLEPLANAMAAFWRAPGPKQVSDVWRHWTELVFHRINQPIESRFQTVMLGSEVRRQLMSDRVVKLSGKAMDEAAEGLRNTNTQARFAEAVDRMYGQYSKFSPAQRRAVALYTPFIAWTLNALRFTAEVLPRDHPALTALIVSAHQTSEEWRKDHGLAKFMEGAVPGFLQGSIPKGEGKLRVSRYTPFGAFGDLPGTLADAVLPQGSSALAALKGQDWKGTKLRDDSGQEIDDIQKFVEAFKALAEGTIPLVGQTVRVQSNEGGFLEGLRQEADPLKPVAPAKRKVRRSGGSSGWGGSSVGPSATGWGG